MRKLWPNTKTLTETEKEEYSNLIEELAQKIAETATDLQKAINQETLRASGAEEAIRLYINGLFDSTIELLKAEHIESTDVTTEELTADIVRAAIELSTQSVTAQMGNILELVANNIRADSVTADEVTATTIRANKADIDEYDITDLHSDNATFDNATADTATIKQADINNSHTNIATIDTLDVTEEATIKQATVEEADVTRLEYEFAINDDDAWQDITTVADADGTVYVQLPAFTNGTYYLSGVDTSNNDRIFTVELLNSIDNRFLRWSDSDAHYLVEAYNQQPNFVIKLNTRGKAIRLYHRADTRDTITPPNILAEYIEPADTSNEYYSIRYKDGNKVWKPFDLMGDGSAVGILTLDQTTDFDEVKDQDQTQYDTSSDAVRTYYTPNQDVNTTADVKFDNVKVGPTDEDTGDFESKTELDNQGNIKNKRLFVGNKNDYDESLMEDGAIVITEGLV